MTPPEHEHNVVHKNDPPRVLEIDCPDPECDNHHRVLNTNLQKIGELAEMKYPVIPLGHVISMDVSGFGNNVDWTRPATLAQLLEYLEGYVSVELEEEG